MREIRRALVLTGLVLVAVAMAAGTGDAKKPGKPKLRAQIAELRGDLAQLSTQVNFTNRTLEGLPPLGGPLCGDPCSTDSDQDGIGDCEDICPCDPTTTDSDGDQTPDCADPCPDDATDACIDPCRMDSDGDGTNDCEDPCPYDPAPAADTDEDGIPDCQDFCPEDPLNGCFDPCLLDQDGDGTTDCRDDCPWAAEPVPGGSPNGFCLPPPVVVQ